MRILEVDKTLENHMEKSIINSEGRFILNYVGGSKMKKVLVIVIMMVMFSLGIITFGGDDKDAVKTNMLETGAMMNIIKESW
ncbi:hypothetical protein Pmob_0690 [Petrotoga mobilis SJ95]|jgi:hypothetical protein|uniref:Uncharacterized protein n=1 Tax=Petrotoga mobilis (strain DSM 10674 / SJ95) TaxID=403833 RepID=A9BFR9_PETMO|nr:hypothetical protein Pmob_0690 [Petrotoga mobilis SJ95]